MIMLYDNAISPFARKVRMVLDHKGLAYETIDGLDKRNHDKLAAVNRRVEVPTLVDGGITVVNSSDIVSYLEHKYPAKPVYPVDLALRVKARAWERCADTVIDAVLVNLSYWLLNVRPDTIPAGLREKAQSDLDQVYDAIECDLAGREFLCGDFSIADIALFPHLVSVQLMNVSYSPTAHANLAAWMKRLRGVETCKADIARARAFMANLDKQNFERHKIFWRGDRIEWMLASGQHKWFMGEIEAGRVIWPGLGIPAAEHARSEGVRA
jgi:glutathione S-transferase